MTSEERLAGLERCEQETRTLVGQGRLRELEGPMRRWQELLAGAPAELRQSLDGVYFSLAFYQLNGALYQNSGQLSRMQEQFVQGQEETRRLEALLPLHASPAAASDRVRQMALNGAEFCRLASLALEPLDMESALELLTRCARLYDWLWPVLAEQPALLTAEVHLKLASLLLIRRDDREGAAAQIGLAKERYRQLYERTGDPQYAEKARHAALKGAGGEVTGELLQSNPAIASAYRTAQLVDTAGQALTDGRQEQAAVAFEKAAFEAERMLSAVQNEETRRIALLAFWGAVTCAGEDPARTARWAGQGLALCEEAARDPACQLSAGELRSMRKDFSRASGGPGLFGRLFGKKG